MIPALCGALIGAGAMIVLFSARGLPAERHAGVKAIRPPREALRTTALVSAASIVAIVATGWLVGGIAAGAAAGIFPRMMASRRQRSQGEARVEAIATWAEMLRDAVVSGRGLHGAISATATIAPLPLRPTVARLVARSNRGPLPPAIRAFADEVADPMADLVAAALLLAATREVRELGVLLGGLASATRDQARLRLTVEAGRASVRTTARAIGFITVAVSAGLLIFRRSYLAPYDTAAGQLALAVIVVLFASGFIGLARLGRPPTARRLRLREVAA